jgi:hypothetical protein
MIKMGNWEDSQDIAQLHMVRAQRENTYLEFGMFPEIADYDDHEIHVEEHNKYRLSTDYEILSRNMPEFAKLFDSHVKQHEMRLAEMAQQMQLMAMQQQ